MVTHSFQAPHAAEVKSSRGKDQLDIRTTGSSSGQMQSRETQKHKFKQTNPVRKAMKLLLLNLTPILQLEHEAFPPTRP